MILKVGKYMEKMATVSEVLSELKKQGYTIDFNLHDNCLLCHGNSLQIHPDDFVVDKHYRFEGPSDPGDEAIVYAISSERHNLKGTLVNGYGIYSDCLTDTMISALTEQDRTVAAKGEHPEKDSGEVAESRIVGHKSLNFETWKLDRLCQYIVSKHHSFTYQQMSFISALAEKIVTDEGDVYPYIHKLSQIFDRMAIDTKKHMRKEERILFPFIEQLVEAAEENVKINRPFFGTVNNPTQVMTIEHEEAAEDMATIRKITDNYRIPANASPSLITLYEKLTQFEADLKTHVYLENHILFPKAILLEKEIGLS